MTREEKQKVIDAVERLNALKQFIGYDKDSEIVQTTQKSLDMAIEALSAEPKTGHWIKSKDGYMRCDRCGSRGSAIKARFCHHCGAKMVETQERSE